MIGIDCFSSNLLHTYHGPKSIMTSDSAPFPLNVNQISTLPLPHILIKTVSQLNIPPGTIAIIPITFNGIPKHNCHCHYLVEPLVQHELQEHLIFLQVLKHFEKLPLYLLCTIINTSPDEVVLPRKRHLGEMKLLTNIEASIKLLVVNEVMHSIDSDHADA